MRTTVAVILCILYATILQGKYIIKGKITERDNKSSLSEVNIYFKNRAKVGTSTNDDGEYKLIAPNDFNFPDTLIFSYTGFKEKSIPVHGNINPYYLNLSLEKENFTLDTIYYEEENSKIDLVLNYGHRFKVTGADVAKDNNYFVTADTTGLIKLWNSDNNLDRNIFFWDNNFVEAKTEVFFSDNEKRVIASSNDRIKLYDFNGKLLYSNRFKTKIKKTLRAGKYYGVLTEERLIIYKFNDDNDNLLQQYKKELFVPYSTDTRYDSKLKKENYSDLNFNLISNGDDIYYTCNDNYHNIFVYKNASSLFIGKLNTKIRSHYYNIQDNSVFVGFDGYFQKYNIIDKTHCNIAKTIKLKQYFKKPSEDYKFLPINGINKISDNEILINVNKNSVICDFDLTTIKLFKKRMESQFFRDDQVINIDFNNNVRIANSRNLWFALKQHNINQRRTIHVTSLVGMENNNSKMKFIFRKNGIITLDKNYNIKEDKAFKNLQDSCIFENSNNHGLLTVNKKTPFLGIIKESKIVFRKQDIHNPNYNPSSHSHTRISRDDLSWDGITNTTGIKVTSETLFKGEAGHATMEVQRFAINNKEFNFEYYLQDFNKQQVINKFTIKFIDNQKDDFYFVPKYNKNIIKNDFDGFSLTDICKLEDNNYRIVHTVGEQKINIVWSVGVNDTVKVNLKDISQDFLTGMTMLKLSKNGKFLAVGFYTGQIYLYKLTDDKKMELVNKLWDSYSPIQSLNFENNNYLISADKKGKVIIYNIQKSLFVKKAFKIFNNNFTISDTYYNSKKELLYLLNKKGDLLIKHIDIRKDNWIKLFFTENGEIFSYDNKGYFYCPEKQRGNIYFIEGVKILKDDNFQKNFYKKSLLKDVL